jgi:purine-binding chemotaxis protein CheW
MQNEAVSPMSDLTQLVVFSLDGQRFALPLGVVERIVRAVEVTPLPNAPAFVLGVIDMAGRVLPVLNLRRRFGLPEREVGPADQFLIARSGLRTVAVVVDEAYGVLAHPETAVIASGRIVPGLEHILGVVRLEDGLVLIHDLENFLSMDEERDLATPMNPEATHGS